MSGIFCSKKLQGTRYIRRNQHAVKGHSAGMKKWILDSFFAIVNSHCLMRLRVNLNSTIKGRRMRRAHLSLSLLVYSFILQMKYVLSWISFPNFAGNRYLKKLSGSKYLSYVLWLCYGLNFFKVREKFNFKAYVNMYICIYS